ncbi:MAG: hypothetical protein R3B48_03495 [Kofleriaceae bacterium]
MSRSSPGGASAFLSRGRWPLAVALLSLACGGRGAPAERPAGVEPQPEPASEFARRQRAACAATGERVTACAITGLRAASTKDELAKLDLEKMQQVNSAAYAEKCEADALSSRQLRVYEVCLREERECEPFLSCLDNLTPQP